MNTITIVESKRRNAPVGRKMPHKRRLSPQSRNIPLKRTKVRKSGKLKIKSISKLMKEADALFSIKVRTEEADKDGICTCYTCGYRAPIKKMQNGHLVSRYYKATRWDRRNCRVQCITCNMWRNGMTPHFAAKLKQELGEGIVDELYEKARQPMKLTREFLTNLIEELKG